MSYKFLTKDIIPQDIGSVSTTDDVILGRIVEAECLESDTTDNISNIAGTASLYIYAKATTSLKKGDVITIDKTTFFVEEANDSFSSSVKAVAMNDFAVNNYGWFKVEGLDSTSQYIEVAVPVSDVLHLVATPFELIPAVAGYAIFPTFASIEKYAGTVYGNTTSQNLQYKIGSNVKLYATPCTGFLDSTSNLITSTFGYGSISAVNTPLMLSVAGGSGELTGGTDADLLIKIRYNLVKQISV